MGPSNVSLGKLDLFGISFPSSLTFHIHRNHSLGIGNSMDRLPKSRLWLEARRADLFSDTKRGFYESTYAAGTNTKTSPNIYMQIIIH
jgi:hypothetical protein